MASQQGKLMKRIEHFRDSRGEEIIGGVRCRWNTQQNLERIEEMKQAEEKVGKPDLRE